MSKSTISTFQLFALFPDEETARVYIEDRLWPKGPVCPDCKSGERVSALRTCATRKAGYYRCLACGFDFTIRTNTIFERSKVPLHKWLYSMYLLVTARKGISSMQLAKEIGVTHKTAWFILGRLREACGGPDGPLDKLRGTIEVDECFVGGIEANKHERNKLHAGRGGVGKVPVLGIRERGGRTYAKVIKNRTIQEIQEVTVRSENPPCASCGGMDGYHSHRCMLDKMVDAVLAYRPKPKSKAAKKRRRKATKKEKG